MGKFTNFLWWFSIVMLVITRGFVCRTLCHLPYVFAPWKQQENRTWNKFRLPTWVKAIGGPFDLCVSCAFLIGLIGCTTQLGLYYWLYPPMKNGRGILWEHMEFCSWENHRRCLTNGEPLTNWEDTQDADFWYFLGDDTWGTDHFSGPWHSWSIPDDPSERALGPAIAQLSHKLFHGMP